MGFLDLLPQRLRELFTLHLVFVRDRMMDVEHLPVSIRKAVKDREPAVHPDGDVAVWKSPKNQCRSVGQHMRVVKPLFFLRKVCPREPDLLALINLGDKGLRKLLQIPKEFLLAGSYHAHAVVQQTQKSQICLGVRV